MEVGMGVVGSVDPPSGGGLAVSIPGDVESLRAAVQEIMAGGGGDVCVSPGVYDLSPYTQRDGIEGIYEGLGLLESRCSVRVVGDAVTMHCGELRNLEVLSILPGRQE